MASKTILPYISAANKGSLMIYNTTLPIYHCTSAF